MTSNNTASDAGHAGGEHEHHHHVTPLRVYFTVFGALLFFTIITVWVSTLGLPPTASIMVATRAPSARRHRRSASPACRARQHSFVYLDDNRVRHADRRHTFGTCAGMLLPGRPSDARSAFAANMNRRNWSCNLIEFFSISPIS